MANTRDPPECSIGKRSGGSLGMGVRAALNAEAEVNAAERCHVFTHVFQPLVLRLYEPLP